MTDYGLWTIQYYCPYVKKYYQSIAANFCVHHNDSLWFEWLTRYKLLRKDLCVKLVTSRQVTLRHVTYCYAYNSSEVSLV